MDSSISIGSGHMMRCLVLADALRGAGNQTAFVCRDLPGSVAGLARQAGHEVILLDPPFEDEALDSDDDARQTLALLACGQPWDWVVVDHYGIDGQWEQAIRRQGSHVLAVDDLADRRHECDVLLDSGDYEDRERRYRGLVSEDCVLFQGPRYALLRPEFLEVRQRARPRDGRVCRLLVFFGGSDPTNQTLVALEGLRLVVPAGIAVDVIIGSSNASASAVAQLCQSVPGARMHVQTQHMAEFMEAADLSVGAGGVAAWERCAVRLPSIVTVVAPNQMESMRHLAARGAIRLAGSHLEMSPETYAEMLQAALDSPAALRRMSERGGEIMDRCELGVAECLDTMLRKVKRD